MADIAKQLTEQQVIDIEGTRLLAQLLPSHWVLREYKPDFGLDFALEVFGEKPPDASTYQTLGEHIFIQLKTSKAHTRAKLKLFERMNVEKGAEVVDKDRPVGEVETMPFSIETSELVTVQRMGAGVPVLLVLADLATAQCHFVCLNDYIEKILMPRHGDYTTKARRTIHVPVTNRLGEMRPLRWFGKRPKLYAAFQKFTYQNSELKNLVADVPAVLKMGAYFAQRIQGYDFWDNTEMWTLISHCGKTVRRFVTEGSPGLLAGPDMSAEDRLALEIHVLWDQLAALPRIYEEVCREWYLPTPLGMRSGG